MPIRGWRMQRGCSRPAACIACTKQAVALLAHRIRLLISQQPQLIHDCSRESARHRWAWPCCVSAAAGLWRGCPSSRGCKAPTSNITLSP
ncbi:hypothetical protein FOA52_003235 [Chlamydomonas sp. UWO 241]|nr:hypothetical protein FOA52_003235 [Chlamydomonas sp. UWO 241]